MYSASYVNSFSDRQTANAMCLARSCQVTSCDFHWSHSYWLHMGASYVYY